MRIVQQVNGLLTGLSTRLSTLVKVQLLPSASKLLASITQAFLSVGNRLLQLAQTMLNIKAWLVNQTTVDQSTKAEPSTAKPTPTQIGQQPATTAPQIHQPAAQAQSRKRGRPVGSTKSAQSHSKETGSAQIRTEAQSTQAGGKSRAHVGLPHQRAKSQSKKGK